MAAITFSGPVVAGRYSPASISNFRRENVTSTSLWRHRVGFVNCEGRESVFLSFGVLPVHNAARGRSSSGRALSQTSVSTGDEKEEARISLKELAESLVLPSGFLSSLPNDLRLDLNDAAFALSNGQINQECGEKVGRLLMDLSQAWEQADTQAAAAVAKEFPLLQDYVSSDQGKAALGKRLQAAGRYLGSTGSYGDGELGKMSKALVTAGGALSVGSPDLPDKASQLSSERVLKFGDLQVRLTKQNAYIGAAIAFVFGVLNWQLSSSLASITPDQSQYANDNSSSLALSLRGTLLAAGYSCAALSGITTAGLLVLAFQVGPEESSQQ